MTRIVAGEARGRSLAVPPRGTRPTSQRAREALFNRLDTVLDLDGAHVLDLYAGSGAIGLEALSRGAALACFVESDQKAADVIAANVRAVLGTADSVPVSIHRRPVLAVLSDPPPPAPYDFVFADPPYDLAEQDLAAVLNALGEAGWLAAHGVVVVERSSRGPEPPWPDALESVASKRYGEGVLWYGRLR